jgi:hypothetical protein
MQKTWEKKGVWTYQKALDCVDKFLGESGAEPSQEARLQVLQAISDRIDRLIQLVEGPEIGKIMEELHVKTSVKEKDETQLLEGNLFDSNGEGG